MAKTITALGILKALEEGLIRSLDDLAQRCSPELEGTLYGRTRIVNLMRMASGARYVEDYSPSDDRAKFNAVMRRSGIAQAVRSITQRSDAEGTRFNYAGAQTEALGLVLRGATKRTLCEYIDDKIWKPVGAHAQAGWLLNPLDRVELAQGGFNATLRDYARLGLMMANDGRVGSEVVVSRDHLLDMTDAARQPESFRPGRMQYHGSTYFGYGLQTWILPGRSRRFMLLGVYGQAILVDPALKLVVVHTAVGKDASAMPAATTSALSEIRCCAGSCPATAPGENGLEPPGAADKVPGARDRRLSCRPLSDPGPMLPWPRLTQNC